MKGSGKPNNRRNEEKMKNSILVNSKNSTLEISKKFDKARQRFGSPEYIELQNARKDNPGFRVVVKASSGKGVNHYKGLSFEYMEKYIDSHDDEEKSIRREYEILRGKSDEAVELNTESYSYMDIKEWFLKKYPAIAEFHAKREQILAA